MRAQHGPICTDVQYVQSTALLLTVLCPRTAPRTTRIAFPPCNRHGAKARPTSSENILLLNLQRMRATNAQNSKRVVEGSTSHLTAHRNSSCEGAPRSDVKFYSSTHIHSRRSPPPPWSNINPPQQRTTSYRSVACSPFLFSRRAAFSHGNRKVKW